MITLVAEMQKCSSWYYHLLGTHVNFVDWLERNLQEQKDFPEFDF